MTAVGTTAAQWDAGSWRAIAAFMLVAVLPAVTIARVARRSASDLTLVQRSAAGVACGAFSWVLVAEILVRAGILTTDAVWAAVSVIGLAAIAVITWDARFSARLIYRTIDLAAPSPASGEPARGEAADSTRVAGSRTRLHTTLRAANSLVPVALIAGSLVPQLRLTRADSFITSTPWYYWLISQALAKMGRVPHALIEWGQPVTTFTFHFGFSSSAAFLSVAHGDPRSLAPAVGIRVLSLVLFAYGVWLLARALGASTWGAAAVAIVAQYVDIYVTKLSSFRPEPTAYGLALIAVALLIWAIKTRSRVLVAAGVAATLAADQIHQISVLLALSLMVGVALILTLSAIRARERRIFLAPMLGFAGSALVLTIALNYIMIGQWSEGDAVAGLPSITDGYDATWAFDKLVTSRDLDLPTIGHNAPVTSRLVADSLQAQILGLPSWSLIALSIALGVGLLLATPWSRRAQYLTILLVAAFGCMLLLSFLISSTGNTYIPRRTGYQRLLQLWPVLPLIAIPAAVSALRWRLVRHIATALLVAGSIVVAWRAQGDSHFSTLKAGQPTSAQLAALQEAPISPGAIVLTNGYTLGFITLQTPGYGLLDGHAPYLERDLLTRVNTILIRAHQYFADPVRYPFPFCTYHVTYVMASKSPNALGTSATWPAGSLHSDQRLALIEENDYFTLYRVSANCPN